MGKLAFDRGRNFGIENALGFGLQALLLVYLKFSPKLLQNEQRQTYTPLQHSSRAHFASLRIEYVRFPPIKADRLASHT